MQLVFSLAPKLDKKCESKHWLPCGADGRSYGHVITKFSRMGKLPHFLSYGAPSTRALRARFVAPLTTVLAKQIQAGFHRGITVENYDKHFNQGV